MSHLAQDHLTDDQFTMCASGSPDEAASEHLRDCPRCREELKAFQETLFDFGRVSEAWSQSVPQLQRSSVLKEERRSLFLRSSWQIAMAAAVAVIASVVLYHKQHIQEDIAARQPSITIDSSMNIAADNKLMQDVYLALSPDDSITLREYQISDSTYRSKKAQN